METTTTTWHGSTPIASACPLALASHETAGQRGRASAAVLAPAFAAPVSAAGLGIKRGADLRANASLTHLGSLSREVPV